MLKRTLSKLAGVTGSAADARADDLVSSVRLPERALSARPTSLSGGQKQRVAIARAFAGEPRLVVCDEPTSALDVSVQAAILNLLVDLQASRESCYVFISHDLGVVRYLSDRIAVLYLGRLHGARAGRVVFERPHHPYTEALLSAVPTIDGEQRATGSSSRARVPSAADPPTGCVFHTRCPRKVGPICETEEPPLVEVEAGHLMRCHIPVEELRALQRDEAAHVGLKIRAAVLEADRCGRSVVEDVELAPPQRGEVLVRLAASGVCHSDQNAIDGTADTPCPAVLGHEGAGVVEAVGEGVTGVAVGDHVTLSWAPSCGRCAECIRDLPQLCQAAWPAMGAGALLDGTTRLSRDGERIHHYSLISSFAEACVVPERSAS